MKLAQLRKMLMQTGKSYFIYKKGWVDFKDNDWKEVDFVPDHCHLVGHTAEEGEKLHSLYDGFVQGKNITYLANFYSRNSVLLGHIPPNQEGDKKVLLNQILVKKDRGPCCIWNEPLSILDHIVWGLGHPPENAKLRQPIQNWKGLDLDQTILKTRINLSVVVPGYCSSDEDGNDTNGRDKLKKNIEISGTIRNILQTIQEFYAN